MSIIYEPHVCDTPQANTYTDDTIDGIPNYDKGTLWECETCGKHWHYLPVGYFGAGRWRRVRFWNLIALYRIRKAAQ